MTKTQIKAELRRSACEDDEPYGDIRLNALFYAVKYCGHEEYIGNLSSVNCSTFFIIVAEAME